MKPVRAEITLRNVEDEFRVKEGHIKEEEIRQVTVEALVDTHAWTLVINEALREKLGLDVTETEPATLADGTMVAYNVAGPIEVKWKNRRTICEALVLPDIEDVLLGAIPLEAMDLTVDPEKGELAGVHGNQMMHNDAELSGNRD